MLKSEQVRKVALVTSDKLLATCESRLAIRSIPSYDCEVCFGSPFLPLPQLFLLVVVVVHRRSRARGTTRAPQPPQAPTAAADRD